MKLNILKSFNLIILLTSLSFLSLSQSRYEGENYSVWVDEGSTFVMLVNKEDIFKSLFDFNELIPETWVEFRTLWELQESYLIFKICEFDSGKIISEEEKTLRLRYPIPTLDLMAENDVYILPEIIKPELKVIPELGYEFKISEKQKPNDFVTLIFNTPDILKDDLLKVNIRESDTGNPIPAFFDKAKSRFDITYSKLPKKICIISVEGVDGKYEYILNNLED